MFAQTDIKTTLENFRAPVLSLYLYVSAGVEENQAATPAWRIFLKNALSEVEAGVNAEDKKAWAAIRDQVNDYFQVFAAASKSLVLFVSENGIEEHELAVPVENQYAFGEPLLAPMLWLEDEYEPYLVVMIDNEQARFLTGYLGGADQALEMEIDLDVVETGSKPRHPSVPFGTGTHNGANSDGLESRLDEHRKRFVQSAIDNLVQIVRDEGIERIVIGGEETLAHLMMSMLPDKLQAKVVTLLNIRTQAPIKEITDRLQPDLARYEREHEEKLLNEVFDLAKSGGRGALGYRAVMAALKEQRVELLVVPYPLEDDKLLKTLPELVAQSSGKIELVHGDAADKLREEGGLAARLYYTRD